MAALIGHYLVNFAAHPDPTSRRRRRPALVAGLDEQHEPYQRLDLPIYSESHWHSGHLAFVADALTTT
ncbi:hypothetical protein LWC35_36995 [Pseudonocardia kujensis]|uniref:hypothetical protein n=1 Tax=Pseudonocardia kujensis TaxID=1128675 RepID=UPI001E3E407E|nr:hypothetical protein [Pseudonocardia kujensis]MCE0768451.1 hypothetical protein [Pseudonocardia kujensis]